MGYENLSEYNRLEPDGAEAGNFGSKDEPDTRAKPEGSVLVPTRENVVQDLIQAREQLNQLYVGGDSKDLTRQQPVTEAVVPESNQHAERERMQREALAEVRAALQAVGVSVKVSFINANIYNRSFAAEGSRQVLSVRALGEPAVAWTMDIQWTDEYIHEQLAQVVQKVYEHKKLGTDVERQLSPVEDTDFIRGSEQKLFELGQREIEKEPGHMQMIDRANELTNQVLARIGRPPVDFSPDAVHIIKTGLWNRKVSAVAVPELDKVFIKETAFMRELDKKLVHELLHIKLGSILPEVLNEALVEETAKELVSSQSNMPDMLRREVEKSELIRAHSQGYLSDEGVPMVTEDTFFMTVDGNGKIWSHEYSYAQPRSLFKQLCAKISQRLPGRFANGAAVKEYLLQASALSDRDMLSSLEQELGRNGLFQDIEKASTDFTKLASIVTGI